MPHVRARNHRRRAIAVLVAGVAMLAFCLITTGSASAAGPRQAATTTTAPPMLPVTSDPSLPQSGFGSERLAGLAVSAILIGWGICSFGRGVRLTYAMQTATTRSRLRHARRPRHSAGFTWH